jgi:hypothetical protein
MIVAARRGIALSEGRHVMVRSIHRVRVGMPKRDGFRSWSEDDIAAFEAVYPVGSKAQLP